MKRSLYFLACVLLGPSMFAGGTLTNLTQADLEVALQGGGTVVFGTHGTLLLTNTILIGQDTTLDAGTNYQRVKISGGGAVRLLQVATNVQFVVKGLTLADGAVVGTNGPASDPSLPGGDADGAGILNLGGRVVLTGCTLTNLSVKGGNASQQFIETELFGNGGRGLGAAIYSLGGALTLTNCTLSSNMATGGLANIGSISGGYAGSCWGGAIYAEQGKLTFANVTFEYCSAVGRGWDSGPTGRGGDGVGAALFATNCAVTITACIFQRNSAIGGSCTTVVGRGCGYGLGGAIFLAQDCSAQIYLSQFNSNSALGGNGYHGNAAGVGRGGAVFNSGDLRVSASTFAQGQAIGGSFAYILAPGQGGAIYSSQSLVLDQSSFLGNVAIGGETGGFANYGDNGEGGAVWVSGGLNATNSTFTQNGAVAGTPPGGQAGTGAGGALYITNADAALVNLTISANGAYATNYFSTVPPGLTEGGGLFSTNSNVMIRNSIVANSDGGGDVWGPVLSAGHNISSDGSAGFIKADPMLAALGQNGGPTPTMAPLVGSPARDAIPSDFPPTDQRGVPRPQGTAADIGAFEADFVSAAPSIIQAPGGANVRAGTNVTFLVQASGTVPLIYQWLKNGQAVNGATQSSLSLSNVQSGDAGTYSVIVTNGFGSAASSGAVLVVDSTPIILSQPVSLIIAAGADAGFSVWADGPALSYQWWHDTTPIPGATATNLVISGALAGAQGNYFVVVTNFAGSVTSTQAFLQFDSSTLSILIPPKDQTVQAGYPATFSVLASGVPPFAYQWQHNGLAVAGATSSALTIGSTRTNDAGNYSVVVTNGYRSITSSTAQLTVTAGPTAPLLVSAKFGQNLTITFNGEAGRTYWLVASSNLVSWDSVRTNTTVSAGPVQFVQPIDPVTGTFYRVVTR
jgi:hypothetical protein